MEELCVLQEPGIQEPCVLQGSRAWRTHACCRDLEHGGAVCTTGARHGGVMCAAGV